MLPIKQSFVLKTKSGRYFQDIFEIQADRVVLEKVMETTDDILKAKKYRTHEEASEEAVKYDFKVLVLSTYIEELQSMWIALTIIFGILLLIAIGNNTVLRQELDAQRYTNVYLFTKYVRNCDIEDIEREIERAKKHFK